MSWLTSWGFSRTDDVILASWAESTRLDIRILGLTPLKNQIAERSGASLALEKPGHE